MKDFTHRKLDAYRASLETVRGEQLLLRIVSMLTKLARGTEGDPES